MPETSSNMKELQDEAYVMRIIEKMGGARAILDDLGEFRRLVDRMWEARPELMEEHPDKWVAMAMDGVVAIGDSENDVLDEVERLGVRRRDVVVEYLETDPPVLIL